MRNGKDRVVITTAGINRADGAKVKVYRLTGSAGRALVGRGTLDAKGRLSLTLKDRNGAARSTYQATVSATVDTRAASTRRASIR